ncbi:MAG: DNA-binding protein [Paludibacteraceae bacterium]|nr:DNA-binding protein [Paludibacteraceae bacterium]
MEKIRVIIERGDDGIYTAVPQHGYKIGFLGCGKTVQEAMDDLENSHKEAKEFMPELPDFEYDITFDVASFLQYIKNFVTLTGLTRITGVNNKQLSHYLTGESKPSAATVAKIQNGVQSFLRRYENIAFV